MTPHRLVPVALLAALLAVATAAQPAPPAWAQDAVWYQIFPERFANGDPTNDTVNDLLIGAQRADPNGNSGAGETYLLSGSDLAFLDAADGTSDGVIDLENANMRIPGFADSHSNGTRTVIPGCADKVRAGC